MAGQRAGDLDFQPVSMAVDGGGKQMFEQRRRRTGAEPDTRERDVL